MHTESSFKKYAKVNFSTTVGSPENKILSLFWRSRTQIKILLLPQKKESHTVLEWHENIMTVFIFVGSTVHLEMVVCMILDNVVLAETQYSCYIVSLLIPREGSDNMTEWLGTNSCSCLDNFPAGQRLLCLRNRNLTVMMMMMMMARLFLDHPRRASRTFNFLMHWEH